MKQNIILILLVVLIVSNALFFVRLLALEKKISAYEGRTQFWDMAVEIIEDCMEYNTLGECKQHYPQYMEQFK